MKTLEHCSDHRSRRARDYPVTGDALDAILSGFEAVQAAGIALPDKTIAWMKACQDVKSKYRKN